MIQTIDPQRIPKLQTIVANDELRPVMNRILLTKTHVVASDAHILVALEIGSVFESCEALISMIPKGGIQISKFAWTEMTKKTAVSIELFMGSITIVHDTTNKTREGFIYRIKIPTFPNNKIEGLYPAWEKVIPKKPKAVKEIGLHQGLLIRLLQLFPTGCCFSMKFYGENKAVMFDMNDEYLKGYVMLMSCIIS